MTESVLPLPTVNVPLLVKVAGSATVAPPEIVKLPVAVLLLNALIAGMLAPAPVSETVALLLVIDVPAGKFSVAPPPTIQVPAVKVLLEICETAPLKLRVPESTLTVPVLLNENGTRLVPVPDLWNDPEL